MKLNSLDRIGEKQSPVLRIYKIDFPRRLFLLTPLHSRCGTRRSPISLTFVYLEVDVMPKSLIRSVSSLMEKRRLAYSLAIARSARDTRFNSSAPAPPSSPGTSSFRRSLLLPANLFRPAPHPMPDSRKTHISSFPAGRSSLPLHLRVYPRVSPSTLFLMLRRCRQTSINVLLHYLSRILLMITSRLLLRNQLLLMAPARG